MEAYQQWLLAGLALLVAAPLAIWLGRSAGRRAARAFPGMAAALMLLNAFFRLDPPPPPKAERVHKNEEDPGAPPKP
jgi:predicted MFS family arabinose efflux permease